MNLHYIENLIETSAKSGHPWDFQCTENITDVIREDKKARQDWYSNPVTRHCFYSGIEPVNPNARLSKLENPPHTIWLFVADFDTLKLSHERILEAVKLMPIKPTRIEKSLGGNWRLVWQLPRGFPVHDHDFCVFLLKRAVPWLNLNVLPCLDEAAFTNPTRYLCNGCQWSTTPYGPIPNDEAQAFFVECAKEYHKFVAPTADCEVPLDVVEKALREKFPNFSWPGSFVVGSQGPSFWVEGSTSPMSAIVKDGGMITFAAHAGKMFYSWSDILGADFAKKWSNASITAATENVFYDGHNFWIPSITKIHQTADSTELHNYLKISCRLSTTADKQTKESQLDVAMNHIYRHNRVAAAGPFVFHRPGIIWDNGERKLNTYSRKPIEPAEGKKTFADMPFIYALWRHMFQTDRQFWHFIATLKRLYESAYYWKPVQHQNRFIAGPKNSGKTLTNVFIIPVLVGGGADASEWVLGESIFNAHLFEVPYWTIDDETVIGSPSNLMRASTMFKKISANRVQTAHAKFQKQARVIWMGAMGITLNMDTNSMRIIGPQDEATLEKTNIYACNPDAFVFPLPEEVARLLAIEIPILARVLLDLEIPEWLPRYNRFGYEAYHDEVILDRTNQAQSIAPFKELAIESLSGWFRENPQPKVWKGTVTQLMRLLAADPRNDHVIRTLKMDQVNRFLEQIQKEGIISCEAESGRLKTRVWVFQRSDFEDAIEQLPAPPACAVEAGTTNTKNPFEK